MHGDLIHNEIVIRYQTLGKRKGNEMHKNCIHPPAAFLLTFAFGLLACFGAQAQFNYTNNGDGTVTLTGYTGGDARVSIPHKLAGYKVSAIGPWAFYQNTTITSITLPECVTTIGDLAFEDCPNLASINFRNGLTTISTSFGGSALANLQLSRHLTSLEGSFWFCLNLTNVTIPASVINIDSDFYYCLNLQTITVDCRNRQYSSVDGVLFNKDQTELLLCPAGKAGVYISPTSVATIGEYAFAWCTNLTEVVLPAGLNHIGFGGLFSCMGLSGITIPASMTSIDDWAFAQCDNLRNLYFQGNAPMLGGFDVFYNDDVNRITAYVLPGTTGWAQFTAMTGIRVMPWVLNHEGSSSRASAVRHQ
jgi:hypothetical protein